MRVSGGLVTRAALGKSTNVFDTTPSTRRPEGFDSKVIPFFHLGGVIIFHEQYGLSTMYLVWINGVSTEVRDGFHYALVVNNELRDV